MVRFSCFLTPVNHTKSKKVVLHSAGMMNSSPQEKPQDRVIKDSIFLDNNPSNVSAEQVTSSSSHDDCSKSDELTGNSCPDESKEFRKITSLKKSKSLGSILDKTRDYDDVTEEGEMDQELSFDYFRTGRAEVDDHAGAGDSTPDKHTENEASEHGYIFSIGVMQHDDAAHSTDHMGDSVHSSTNNLPIFAKSRSAANLRVHADSSIEGCMTHELSGHRSRSVQDLCSLHEESDEYSNDDNTHCYEAAFQRDISADLCSLHEESDEYSNDDNTHCYEAVFQRDISASFSQDIPESSNLDGKEFPCHAESRDDGVLFNTSDEFNEVVNQDTDDSYFDDKIERENQPVDDGYKVNIDDNFPDRGTKPEIDGYEIRENLQNDSSIQTWDQELTSEELNIKRIEDWISKIDTQNDIVVEELGESSSSVPKKDPHISKKDPRVLASVASTKHDASNLGMEVAYKYISSLPPSSSSAQMSNLGLVAVPFLGAFVSLRMLNLSGNNIVRITAGALPKGLHTLNLSKNNTSTIEGLRDLTRLRVLDLSFNRITRIGHGLASCSSLKELYLAGNKISEVEGLHRLLKLNVLDLRFNKISTAKGLGQLAANYGSLQAINLERNPAQINVGDEHLKKYLLSLLPNLVYYNKHTIRAGNSKDVTDRPPRSLTSHMRTEQTGSRRGSHGSGLYRSSSSLSGWSKGRHVRLPPAGSKATNYQPYGVTKQSSSRPSNPIHRSLSEGML